MCTDVTKEEEQSSDPKLNRRGRGRGQGKGRGRGGKY
jgi:hypothetical protein